MIDKYINSKISSCHNGRGFGYTNEVDKNGRELEDADPNLVPIISIICYHLTALLNMLISLKVRNLVETLFFTFYSVPSWKQ